MIKTNKTSRFMLILTFGVLLSLLLTPVARAGLPKGDNFVIFDDPESEEYPALAYNPDRGEYLVVWHNDWPANDDIRARLIAEDGTPLGDAFYISGGAGEDRRHPDVVYNHQEREYLIVWESTYPGGLYCVYARQVSESGQVLGTGDTLIHCLSGVGEMLGKPALAYASTANQYFVVWYQKWFGAVDILGMALSGAGVPSFTLATISADPGNPRYNRGL